MNSNYPTPLHQEIAELVISHFEQKQDVDSILLLNSCARGKATPKSDLDMAILLHPHVSAVEAEAIEVSWQKFAQSHPRIAHFTKSGLFTKVHLDFIDGVYEPIQWDDGGGPDDFEIANT